MEDPAPVNEAIEESDNLIPRPKAKQHGSIKCPADQPFMKENKLRGTEATSLPACLPSDLVKFCQFPQHGKSLFHILRKLHRAGTSDFFVGTLRTANVIAGLCPQNAEKISTLIPY
jgi:hypothetical protein